VIKSQVGTQAIRSCIQHLSNSTCMIG
jgi:hypothetical protein